MKYTKNQDIGLRNYWVKVKKVGSKYTKLIPRNQVGAKINTNKSIVKIGMKEHTLNIPKTEYRIVY